jgi:maltooligosyltrehalose trehalohydrolase
MNPSEAAAAAQESELGAVWQGPGEARFVVWAPFAMSVEVHISEPEQRHILLEPAEDGYHRAIVSGLPAGARYKYRLNGGAEFPDPASRSQPAGVHGPSEIIDSSFEWHDAEWRGIALRDYIFYEVHVGTFTAEGTFDAAIHQLDSLVDLGVTAVELMPVAQFPGTRNWGYDGVYPFAVQHSYGGAAGLKRFVDAAHGKGLAVVLDVVYNHLGPEGNYFSQFGPYFTDRYHTPWGLAVNFDGDGSPEVRRFVVENAVRWVAEFHIDALRLDAVHAIFDASPTHILRELAHFVHLAAADLGRDIHVIAESDLNDARLVEPPQAGGYGLDSQWADDFHHALHALSTGERDGYYQDFGSIHDVAKVLTEGFVFTGQHSAFRGRPHGTSGAHLPAERFVVCAQNHDQIGNRMLGERLGALLDFESLKVAAGALLLSPFLPLLFMGQEWCDPAPFLYFVDHSDPGLIEAVRQGRRREFAAFAWLGEVPDAQAPETFERSKPNWALRDSGRHQAMLDLYRELIRLRRKMPAIRHNDRDSASATVLAECVLAARRREGEGEVLLLYHFGADRAEIAVPCAPGAWEKVIDSAEARWLGAGSPLVARAESNGSMDLTMSPKSFAVFQKTDRRP